MKKNYPFMPIIFLFLLFSACGGGDQGALPRYAYYKGVAEVRGWTRDESPRTFVIKVNLGYDREDKKLQGELISRKTQIQDYIRRYISSKTLEDLSAANEPKLKENIKEMINQQLLIHGEIRDVVFITLQVYEF